ncbi:hypothetical protein SPIRO4BDMA_70047 [uncultured spirochete]|uniref:Uncharacterized protein n=1 Tax=uncultured spirochete TaxID=156406 RepID=A0A3P3XTK4_9SPIR|nr:hypothetical protein SPIRO4BDMA_70047 [uncultured spirochete]
MPHFAAKIAGRPLECISNDTSREMAAVQKAQNAPDAHRTRLTGPPFFDIVICNAQHIFSKE